MRRRHAEKFLVAWFDKEQHVLEATRAARRDGFRIYDVFTPYAVHGMDDAMGLRPSRITWICCALGVLGLVVGLGLQHWTSGVDWPLNVGGKPFHSLPAFIPVAFEITILFAGLGTVAALLLRTRLLPGMRPRLVLDRVTEDRFALALVAGGDEFNLDDARALFAVHGASATSLIEATP